MNSDFLRTGDVLSLLGISRSTLDLWIAKGHFPKPSKLGSKLNVWSTTEVETWLSNVGVRSDMPGGDA